MDHIVFQVFRRMRMPILALIGTYTIAIIGLVLIPGQDDQGNTWHMGFFHAFYFVSFMSTTIGFGEIPYAFTEAQRLWVIFTIFATVIVWLYSIGTVLALLQDKAFQRAFVEFQFARRVKRLVDPFYLVCGYGETGSVLVKALTDRNHHAVIMDIDETRINRLQLDNLREFVPALCADARDPDHLLKAGLKHSGCEGVVAITNVNETNLKIAIAAKLLNSDLKVICRSDSYDVESNMASFGTDHIYNPFDIFAANLATALQSPCVGLLHDWLGGLTDGVLRGPVHPPAAGLWVLCGFGRFGKAIYSRLIKVEHIELVVIEQTPEHTGKPASATCIVGRGTEAITLQEAGIERAVGLVAGTDDDANNLSIVMTARELNPDLFVILRENCLENEDLFEAIRAQAVMHPSSIVANRIRVLLATPMLNDFIDMHDREDAWACKLVTRLSDLLGYRTPEVWEISIDPEQAYALQDAFDRGEVVTLAHILTDPRDRECDLPAIALLLEHGEEQDLLPTSNRSIEPGDRILFGGSQRARSQMGWTLQNYHALNYVMYGSSVANSLVWRWLTQILK